MKVSIIKTLIGCLFITAAVTSCKVIDQDPESQLSQNLFFETEEDAEAAIMAAYDGMQGLPQNIVIWGDIRADHLERQWGAGAGSNVGLMFDNQNVITPDNSFSNWREVYSIINRINNVIAFVPGISDKDAGFTALERDRVVAEAHFLRALSYFYLVRVFGDVPIVTEPSVDASQDFKVKQSKAEDVLKLIEEDLTKARASIRVDYGNNASTRGRATVGAVRALYVDVAMWRAGFYDQTEYYQKAADTAKAIMDTKGLYNLVSGKDWFSMFGTGNSGESIFELQFDFANQEFNGLNMTYAGGRGNYWFDIDPEFKSNWISSDVRGEGATYFRAGAGYWSTRDMIWKYIGLTVDTTSADIYPKNPNYRLDAQSYANFIIYRLADIILLRAEALNRISDGESQEAIDLLNMVRSRAGIPPASVTTADTMEEIEKAIIMERGLELAVEGKRWFDLMRTELVNELTENEIPKGNGWFMPVFRSELILNPNLVQNPYYK